MHATRAGGTTHSRFSKQERKEYLETLNRKLCYKLDELLVDITALYHFTELEVAFHPRQQPAEFMKILLLSQPLLPAQHGHNSSQNPVQKSLPRLLIGKQGSAHGCELRKALHCLSGTWYL